MRASFTAALLALCLNTVPGAAVASGDVIWQVRCTAPELDNLMFDMTITPDDVVLSDLGNVVWWGENYSLLGSYHDLVVIGDSGQLLVSNMGVHGMPMTFRMEWWGSTRPPLVNSYFIDEGWGSKGELSTGKKFDLACMPIIAPKGPEGQDTRYGFFGNFGYTNLKNLEGEIVGEKRR